MEALRGLKHLPKVARDDSLSWADAHQRNPARHPQRARDVEHAVRIPAGRFANWYFSSHPEEKLPMPEGFGPPDYTDYNPELDAVMLALHPGEIETPSTDSWLLQESERLKAHAKSQRMTLNQLVWKHEYQTTKGRPAS
jgi:hypothetical protein